jgi:hypothetical protein
MTSVARHSTAQLLPAPPGGFSSDAGAGDSDRRGCLATNPIHESVIQGFGEQGDLKRDQELRRNFFIKDDSWATSLQALLLG